MSQVIKKEKKPSFVSAPVAAVLSLLVPGLGQVLARLNPVAEWSVAAGEYFQVRVSSAAHVPPLFHATSFLWSAVLCRFLSHQPRLTKFWLRRPGRDGQSRPTQSPLTLDLGWYLRWVSSAYLSDACTYLVVV